VNSTAGASTATGAGSRDQRERVFLRSHRQFGKIATIFPEFSITSQYCTSKCPKFRCYLWPIVESLRPIRRIAIYESPGNLKVPGAKLLEMSSENKGLTRKTKKQTLFFFLPAADILG
jgi:hypothetical protein